MVGGPDEARIGEWGLDCHGQNVKETAKNAVFLLVGVGEVFRNETPKMKGFRGTRDSITLLLNKATGRIRAVGCRPLLYMTNYIGK